ncbi:MAG: hypothetical protein HY902_15520 [Deltaproteobacteria bacterium]|nr:hypothetical protein [Deltaproteobacteria bacterium]
MQVRIPQSVLAAVCAVGLASCGAPASAPTTAVAPDAADSQASTDAATDSAAEVSASGVDAGADSAPDAVGLDAAPLADGAAQDTGDPADAVAGVDAAADVSAVSCVPGAKSCEGPKLKTCLSKGNGYSISNCVPGTTCMGGQCKPVAANLIIAFDTSGSMSDDVKIGGVNKCSGNYEQWPDCEYVDPKFAGGCTRMGVSKYVFKQALAKIDETTMRMALFRFPQTSTTSGSYLTCSSGHYSGNEQISGDKGDQSVSDNAPLWYWSGLSQIQCVPFPTANVTSVKDAMLLWMDGKESMTTPVNPELRPDGSTPLGKTLFYLGEYIRNRVIIDGKPCTDTDSCQNINYVCQDGACVDPNRSCRETVVVMFTDGGQDNTNTYFAPWVQAKRLSSGLFCQSDADCVGGTTCQNVKNCKSDKGSYINCLQDSDCAKGGKCTANTLCLPPETITGYFCSKGLTPCLPDATAGQAAFCDGLCVPDPRPGINVKATTMANNVLRSPDGKPFSVKVIVVDISGSTSAADISGSASLAISGGGKLLGADASDPSALLQSLDAAFDIKTKKICGQ